MKIYIDNDYKCYVLNNDNRIEVETSIFDGKCKEYIEGYRFIPSGKSWQREDGKIFFGEMITPWKDYRDLDIAQRYYEQNLLSQYKEELAELDIMLIDVQYQNLVGGI